MKAIYTGLLRKVLQWAGKLKKEHIKDIISMMVKANSLKHSDGKKFTGTEKAETVLKQVQEKYLKSESTWVLNLIVQGIFAYARYKGKI